MRLELEQKGSMNWQKVVCLDWDMTLNSAETDITSAHETKCIVPLPRHLETLFKILQANGVKVVSLSQRNMYIHSQMELGIQKQMTDAMDAYWGTDRTFLQKKDLEFLGGFKPTANENYTTKNRMIAGISGLADCKDIKPHNFIVVDDNIQYFAPSEELNYQFLHVRRTWGEDYSDFQPFLRLLHLACPKVNIEEQFGRHCTDSEIANQLKWWWKIYRESLTPDAIKAGIQGISDGKDIVADIFWIADHFEFLNDSEKEQSKKMTTAWVNQFIKVKTSEFNDMCLKIRRDSDSEKSSFETQHKLLEEIIETQYKLLEEIIKAVTLLHARTDTFSTQLGHLKDLQQKSLPIKDLQQKSLPTKKEFIAKIPELISTFEEKKYALQKRLKAAEILIRNNALTDGERALSKKVLEDYVASCEQLLDEAIQESSSEKLPTKLILREMHRFDKVIASNQHHSRISGMASKASNFIQKKFELINMEFEEIKAEALSKGIIDTSENRKLILGTQKRLLDFLSALADAFEITSMDKKQLELYRDQVKSFQHTLQEDLYHSATDQEIKSEKRAVFRRALFNELGYLGSGEKILVTMNELDNLCCEHEIPDRKRQDFHEVVFRLQTLETTLKLAVDRFVKSEASDNTRHITNMREKLIGKSEAVVRKLMRRLNQEKHRGMISDCFNKFQQSVISQQARKSGMFSGRVDRALLAALSRVATKKDEIFETLIREKPTLALPENRDALEKELHLLFLTASIDHSPTVQDCSKVSKSLLAEFFGFSFR